MKLENILYTIYGSFMIITMAIMVFQEIGSGRFLYGGD